LRDDYERFSTLGAEVLAVSAEPPDASDKYLTKSPMPFPTLVDESHAVFDDYDVTSRLMSLGQRPAVFVIDADGIVRFEEVGAQQWNIPTNELVLGVLESMRA